MIIGLKIVIFKSSREQNINLSYILQLIGKIKRNGMLNSRSWIGQLQKVFNREEPIEDLSDDLISNIKVNENIERDKKIGFFPGGVLLPCRRKCRRLGL